jgi:glyoxylase-like metal-dependent hydrolase (beta-lactamase superfamily II)
MTHLHVDHASAMSEFPRASFICTEREWRAANAPRAVWRGYVSRQFPDPARVRLVSFDQQPTDGTGAFERAIDLFGDGSITLVDTPGHSAGHMSVLVCVAGGEALLAGDAIYTLRNLRERILPWRTIDDATYTHTLDQLQAYTERRPDALLIPTHDHEVWDSLDERY